MFIRKPRSDSAKKSQEPLPPSARYFEDGATWEHEIYRSLRASTKRAWIITSALLVVTTLSLLSLVLLLPLKEFAPYVVTVDRSTGYVEVTRGLKPGPLTQDEAITQANLVRYVIARETYDPPDLEENYNRVVLMSEGEALEAHQNLWDASNPDNPAKVFGHDVETKVTIKSVTFLNEKTASVRFYRVRTERNVEATTHWVAIINFHYVDRPTRLLERFENPLGFKVMSYRVDQEVLDQ